MKKRGRTQVKHRYFPYFCAQRDRYMALQDKYINPFTDFGFKKLFGSEPNKDLLIDDEKTKYEESLKYYRDLKNVVDTSFDEGKIEGKIEIARQMKSEGEPIEKIVRFTGLTGEEIEKL